MEDDDDDDERTVIRPAPGRRRDVIATRPSVPAVEPVSTPILASPLAAAATPLLQLLARLSAAAKQPDPAELRERAAREIRAFERRARQGAVDMELLRPAHYALCAGIDDAVLSTAWGAESDWRSRTLVSAFHQNSDGGRQFLEILARLRQEPGRYLPVLEIVYLCLSFGFMKRSRQNARRVEQLRQELSAEILSQRGRVGGELSPAWRGTRARYSRGLGVLPIWIAGGVSVAVLAGCFLWVSSSVSTATLEIRARLTGAPPGRMPAIVRPAPVQDQ